MYRVTPRGLEQQLMDACDEPTRTLTQAHSPSPSPSPNQVRPDDPLQAKAILESGGKILKPVSPAFTEPARLTTLALHSDWVSSLAYEESTP